MEASSYKTYLPDLPKSRKFITHNHDKVLVKLAATPHRSLARLNRHAEISLLLRAEGAIITGRRVEPRLALSPQNRFVQHAPRETLRAVPRQLAL